MDLLAYPNFFFFLKIVKKLTAEVPVIWAELIVEENFGMLLDK